MHSPDKGKGKRVAPISSGAFSFSLSATEPVKKPRKEGNGEDGLGQRSPLPAVMRRSADSPVVQRNAKTEKALSKTPQRPEIQEGALDARRPPSLRSMQPPPSLSVTPRPRRAEVQTPSSAARRIAPPAFSLSNASPKGHGSPASKAGPSRLQPVIGEGSPYRLPTANSELKAERVMQGITSLSQIALTPSMQASLREDVQEDSEVSPRKRKAAYRKSGESISARLARAVSTADTALIVFYTSLLHSGRVPPPHATEKRVKEAPVQLRVIQPLRSPSPSSAMAECRVLKWSGGGASPQYRPDDVVTVVFRSLPADCPRVGRALELLDENTRAGVWFPTTEVAIPPQTDLTNIANDVVNTGETELGSEGPESAQQQGRSANITHTTSGRVHHAHHEVLPVTSRPVMFASRYLLVG